MKNFFKTALLSVLCIIMLCGLAVSTSAADIAPGKTYIGSIMGERGAGFKFYYSNTPKTESPLDGRVALNMLIMDKDPWPWKDDGMYYYAEKADGTNAIIGIALPANRIALTTYIKNDAIRRPMIAFTAPADGNYTFSYKARLLWSPTEIGLEIWVGGVKNEDLYYVVTDKNTPHTGTVYLEKGQELVIATVNHAWQTAENTALIEDLLIKYNGDPFADESPKVTTTPEQTTTPEGTTPEQTTAPDTTESENEKTDDGIDGKTIGIIVAAAVAVVVVAAVIVIIKRKKGK